MAYQVFLSFKNTDGGQMTEDRAIAEKLYKALSERGIETFYSNITLLEFGEATYKDDIDKALSECRLLVVIGTRKEYLNSSWIKYEWGSFQQDLLSDIKKGSIITYLDSVPLQDVPLAIRHYQSFSVSVDPVEKLADYIVRQLAHFIDKKEPDPQKRPEESADGRILEKQKSNYDPAFADEERRLAIQAANTRGADMPAIEEALASFKDRKIFILDAGCAYGYVGKDRFHNFDNVTVLGVDVSAKAVEKARSLNKDDRFLYEVLDLESPTFKNYLQAIMTKHGIPSFDVIFGALLLLHLKDPIRLLRNLRGFLSDDGYIIMRGSDDGTVVAYNDEGLVAKIIAKHHACPGVSDRTNGRKLYYQLYTTGYRQIKTFGYFKNIGDMDFDDRHDVFEERFAYRRNYLVKALEENPYDLALKNDLGWMDYALSKLEEIFGNQAFWYCETDICALARKK